MYLCTYKKIIFNVKNLQIMSNYSKEILEKIIKESYSWATVMKKLRALGFTASRPKLYKQQKEFNLDISHFTGPRWNKGKTGEFTALISLKDIVKESTNYSSTALKHRLIDLGLKEWKCEICGNTGEWNGKPLILELHHVNGNHFDNRLENLQILCPNCHSQTEGHRKRGKNNKGQRLKPVGFTLICKQCGKEFIADRRTRKFCSNECYTTFNKILNHNVEITKEVLIDCCAKFSNISDLANHLNTSRTNIRNWLRKYNLYEEFKMKYDFHAKPVQQLALDGTLIKEWPSVQDAHLTLNIHSIEEVANGKRRSAGGFLWKYKN